VQVGDTARCHRLHADGHRPRRHGVVSLAAVDVETLLVSADSAAGDLMSNVSSASTVSVFG
jgi:hypothetical protein